VSLWTTFDKAVWISKHIGNACVVIKTGAVSLVPPFFGAVCGIFGGNSWVNADRLDVELANFNIVRKGPTILNMAGNTHITLFNGLFRAVWCPIHCRHCSRLPSKLSHGPGMKLNYGDSAVYWVISISRVSVWGSTGGWHLDCGLLSIACVAPRVPAPPARRSVLLEVRPRN